MSDIKTHAFNHEAVLLKWVTDNEPPEIQFQGGGQRKDKAAALQGLEVNTNFPWVEFGGRRRLKYSRGKGAAWEVAERWG